ncbi:hypothetical protein [Streptomyces sp. ST2-7A]|uniref:hypothetical protein n=1 Tax=Streptomyces sp. ST2-7A TaxID=2907214 RepID=UPI001F365DAD|nr:hypothetical protein [Streptomyces sp. ST2-7A]MCE7082926.1 hypothetical protein [Streptomyces sp. ST2-7A]
MSGESTDATGRARVVGQEAGEEASATARVAGQAAESTMETAGREAGAVMEEARHQADTAVRELRTRVSEEAGEQTRRAAGTLRRWADDLAEMAEHGPDDSPARTMVAQSARRGHRAAEYLDHSGVDGLLNDLRRFARRRPGAFLASAALTGLVVGRLARASREDGSSDTSGHPTHPPALDSGPAPAPTGTPPGVPAGGDLPGPVTRPGYPGHPEA